jgi:aspartyl-tRNA(Asn)/glutamyl-tRNA(Gln) amidotransferase subunit C
MEKKDIEHLAKLARIEVTDTEAQTLAGNITSILAYVSEIEKATGKGEEEKKVGPLYNVMREDVNPHEPGLYTEDLLNLVPERKGQYVQVKKILEDKS